MRCREANGNEAAGAATRRLVCSREHQREGIGILCGFRRRNSQSLDGVARDAKNNGSVQITPQTLILIVDDDPAMRESLKRMLSPFNYRVLLAGSRDEAFQQAHEHGPPDLLVADVILPDMDGRELARWMRGAYPKTKLLFISGAEHENLAEALSAGNATFLRKPFSPEQFVHAVQELLPA
jgi:two-component system, cell cycle sensor histidine kinase and response regulator CckA